MIINLLNIINSVIGSYPFLFAAESIAIIIKSYILFTLFSYGLKSEKIQKTWFFLILVLIGSITTGIAWIIKLIQILFLPNLDYRIITFFIRFAWAFHIVQYQSLAFFIESLVEKKFKLTFRRILFIVISAIPCFIFLYLAFFNSYKIFNSSLKPKFEFTLLSMTTIYGFLVILPSSFISLLKLSNPNIPKILKKQLKLLLFGLIFPVIFFDLIQIYPFNVVPHFIASNYAIASISTLLIAWAAFYSTKRVMRLRFLNLRAHVQSQKKYNFINKFIEVLERLSYTTNSNELIHITKNFFKESLEIPTGRTSLFIRNLDKTKNIENSDIYNFNVDNNDLNKLKIEITESFINESSNVNDFLKQSKILIYDDIEFSSFYVEDKTIKNCLNFLNRINIDMFIPIYKKQTIIAYIIIERDNNSKQLYSNLERDEIVVFSSYLANVINLLQNRNLELLIEKEKELKEELYLKHQEINQYKESIRSFLKRNQQRKIGILFYKNRKFIFGNQDAKDLISINVNILDGHSLTQSLKKIAKQVEDYKSSQVCYTKDTQGNKIVLMGIPNLENSNIIILVYYPDISDTIKQQIDLLNDPSKWDYLLYLETTKSGQLINQLIPGSGEMLLNFKINLLKIALGKGAILLDMPEEDLIPTIEIIHHISLRGDLHILKLQSPIRNLDIAIKLFGINSLIEKSEPNINKPLMQKLDNNGTLFIQNIHFLDLETQEYLAEFLKHGYFHILKSDKKIFSDVRVICSTNLNIKDLIQENKFSKTLYSELKNNLTMPSLFTLSEVELSNLAEGYSEQAIQTNTFKNLLELTDKEKMNIINKQPVSLQEFKTKVQNILNEKSKKNNVQEETHFDPAFNITDPKLIEAARLGKYALKDPKMLAILWNKFKNQNKIATFLGVNRSSVHRRFKEYKID